FPVGVSDIAQAAVLNLTAAAANRIRRFRRLQQKLSVSIEELDKTIAALQPAELTDEFVQQLAVLKGLRANLKVPLVEMLSWWGNIDTQGDDSLYSRAFVSPLVLQNPPDHAFTLNAGGTELLDATNMSPPKLMDHATGVLAGVRLTSADL